MKAFKGGNSANRGQRRAAPAANLAKAPKMNTSKIPKANSLVGKIQANRAAKAAAPTTQAGAAKKLSNSAVGLGAKLKKAPTSKLGKI